MFSLELIVQQLSLEWFISMLSQMEIEQRTFDKKENRWIVAEFRDKPGSGQRGTGRSGGARTRARARNRGAHRTELARHVLAR